MVVKIESSSNPVFKNTKKLLTNSGRKKSYMYLAEGRRSVSDAIKNNANVKYIIALEGTEIDFDTKNIPMYEFSKKLFNEISLTVHSQGIVAAMECHSESTENMSFENMSTIVYLDSVTDPGNMGTILRSADALGADAIVISKGCVDIYNPKVVRSSMASILNVPVFEDSASDETFAMFKANGFDIAGTFLDGDVLCCNAEFNKKTVVVMGNEANGISNSVRGLCTMKVKIPMVGSAESLNVSTAATVILYEIMRNKIKRGV